jgi:hypothetical protein
LIAVEHEVAQLRAVEVVLRVGFSWRAWRIRERDERRLVVDEEIDSLIVVPPVVVLLAVVALLIVVALLVIVPIVIVLAIRLERDPVRDRLEPVAACERLAHGDQRRHRRPWRDGREHRRLCGLEAVVPVMVVAGERAGCEDCAGGREREQRQSST